MADANQTSSSRIFSAIRAAQDADLRLADPHERARARARLLQAIDRNALAPARPTPAVASRAQGFIGPSGPKGWRWTLGGLAAAACTVAVIAFINPQGTEQVVLTNDELSFTVDGQQVTTSEVIVASEYSRAIAFDDSTRVELSPYSAMRVSDLRSNGATVQLERGEVTLAVHHEDDTSWRVAAGPWSVHVTGTQFSVAWDPSTEHFRVAVTEGSVRVEGPEGELAKLRAGESLVRERRVVLADGAATQTVAQALPMPMPAIEAEPSPSEPGPTPVEPADAQLESKGKTPAIAEHSQATSKSKPALDWQALSKNAEYEAAWAAIEALPDGALGEAERRDADTLLELADVARYNGERSDAKAVLVRLRERFPGSDAAGDAAFELGRLADDAKDDAKAASWFELYLDERPKGSLVNDALGRLMNAYVALGRNDQAEATAERYLERQPNGPHAAKARKILGQ